jgi:hypothetical protein
MLPSGFESRLGHLFLLSANPLPCQEELRRFFLHWLPVHEPLTLTGRDRNPNALAIVTLAGIPLKLGFSNVPMQMFLADGMVRPVEFSLEQTEEALGSIDTIAVLVDVLFGECVLYAQRGIGARGAGKPA